MRGRLITQTDPASARDSFAYDGNDRVTSWTTRRNQTITYSYDDMGRLDTKVVPNDGTWTYGYHGTYGTLDTLVTPSASVYRTHDPFGRLTEEKTVVSGITRIVSYGYDAQGVLDSLTDPWGGVYSFGWDGANRARTITNPFSESFSIRHSSEGMVNQIVFPTGSDNLAYDASHLLRSAGLSGEVTLTRDTVTKGLASIKLGGMAQTFSYDGFGRLASEAQDSATGTYGPASESYTYDAAGNRNQASYSYTSTNAVRGRPAIGGDGFAPGDSLVYDASGNPTWWKNKTTGWYDSLTWDAEDRLIRLRRYSSGHTLQLDINYLYDGFGRRVKKWGTGVTAALYVWDGWNLLAETAASGGGSPTQRYTHALDAMDFPLAMRQNSTTSLFHLDPQGNVYLLTDTAGTRRSEYRYRGHGDRYVTPVGEAVQSPFTFRAREEDRETGLIYMRHRYYSPRLERFVNQDPIGIGGGLNTYSFGGSSPVNFADPLGLCCTLFPPIIPFLIPHELEPIEVTASATPFDFGFGPAIMGDQFAGWAGPGGHSNGLVDFLGGAQGGRRGRPGLRATGRSSVATESGSAKACVGSIVSGAAAIGTDAVLAWVYWSGAGLLLRGMAMLAEGWAMGNGLIPTATVERAGTTGATLMWAGKGATSTGTNMITGSSALFPNGVSLWPGGNSLGWAQSGGLQCGG